MDLISRPNYYSKLEKLLGKGVLIVLTGQRRVGKSYVMKELVARKQAEAGSNVIYIDKEKTAFDAIATYKDLVAYVDERLDKSKHNHLLIDEVQEIKEFGRGLRNYYSEPYIDIVVTGSNSDILSSDLGTMLSGRYIEVYIQGLSYPEFLEFHGLEDGESAMSKYIAGFPACVRSDWIIRRQSMITSKAFIIPSWSRTLSAGRRFATCPSLKTLFASLPTISENRCRPQASRTI